MAKLFTGKKLDPNQVNIPTQEQNQAEFLSMQAQSQRMIDLQTKDMLIRKQKEQSGDADLASLKPEEIGTYVMNQEYGQSGDAALNQDMTQLPKGEDAVDIDRSSISRSIDLIPSEFIYFFLGIISILLIKFLFKKRD